MSLKDDGGPAFPVPEQGGGMSLRDYFASAVLPSVYSGLGEEIKNNRFISSWRSIVAGEAYRVADAMLSERSKT